MKREENLIKYFSGDFAVVKVSNNPTYQVYKHIEDNEFRMYPNLVDDNIVNIFFTIKSAKNWIRNNKA